MVRILFREEKEKKFSRQFAGGGDQYFSKLPQMQTSLAEYPTSE